MAVGRYRALFAEFRIQAQDILLRLRNRTLDIGPHVQSYLADLSMVSGRNSQHDEPSRFKPRWRKVSSCLSSQ